MTALILNWRRAYEAGVLSCGGKGYRLAKLHGYGFPVPDGGVVVPDVYRQLIHMPGLAGSLRAVSNLRAEEVTEPMATQAPGAGIPRGPSSSQRGPPLRARCFAFGCVSLAVDAPDLSGEVRCRQPSVRGQLRLHRRTTPGTPVLTPEQERELAYHVWRAHWAMGTAITRRMWSGLMTVRSSGSCKRSW